jgi:hypothetical protein
MCTHPSRVGARVQLLRMARILMGCVTLVTVGAGCQDRTAARDGGPLPHSGDTEPGGSGTNGHLLLSDAGPGETSDAATTPAPSSVDAAVSASWTLPGCTSALPAGTDLEGTWVGPAGEVWAVGKGGEVGRRAPDAAGGAWCWATPGSDATLNAVWGSASDAVWIVGDGGQLLKWDGSGFSSIDTHTTSALQDVWGAGGQLFVVGDAGVARHFDGTSWASVDLGGEHQLLGVWGTSAQAIWAVGSQPVHGDVDGAEAEVFRWQAGAWVKQAGFVEERGAAGFYGLSGSGPDDVWAVGTKFPSGAAAGFAFVAHFDGSAWTAMDAPEDTRINRRYTDVISTGAGGAWICALGDTGVKVDGGTFSAGEAATSNLLAVDAHGSELWATGRDGKVMRRSSSGAWTVDLPATPAAAP